MQRFTRRQVLHRAALGLGVLVCDRAAGATARHALARSVERAAYVGVETSGTTGASRARFFTDDGGPAGLVPLDFRAHGMTRSGATLAVFPRRPGTRFALVDLGTLDVRAVVDAPPDRHFYGHGAFTADGRHLLVTENDLTTLEGGIGIYDVAGPVVRVAAFVLPGHGPHDIRRVDGSDGFQIALGGLMTHPDYGRTPLNVGDFTSDVVTLDPGSGAITGIQKWADAEGAPLGVSLRHLAADGRGRLYVGGQRVKGPPRRDVLWLVENGTARGIDVGDRLGGYVSSVAAAGRCAAVTSKETGRVLVLDGDTVVGERRIDGASAVAVARGEVIASGYAALHAGDETVAATADHEFDNHGLALEAP